MKQYLLNAIENPYTTVPGIVALLGGLAALFGDLATFTHALAVGDLNAAWTEIRPLGVDFAAVAGGFIGIHASDAKPVVKP